MNVIFLGPPGAGKGTQAQRICDALNIPQISTGDILRRAMKEETPTGLKAKQFVEAGKLVPDEVIIDIVRERLAMDDCQNGYILDGFPRTVPQAEALDSMQVTIDKVIDIEVADEKIVERMSGRRVCPQCGASYHLIYKKPVKDGICNSCAGALVQRKDDHPDVVTERLKVYHEQTEPLCEYYRKTGKLKVAQGCIELEDTTRNVNAALGL